MKKIIFFLITMFLVLNITEVNAANNFYEAEYIDNIYTIKVKNNTIYYEQARFFKEKNTNNPIYCIEPFATFSSNSTYQEGISNALTESQKERISLLSYYGYNYPEHQENKWYAITQLLIWQTADPTAKYYFTDTLNGNKIERFTQEINELETLISNHKTKPSVENNTYYVMNDYQLVITDQNKVLNNYNIISNNAIIENNMIITNKLPVGEHKIILERKQIYSDQQKSYISPSSQDLITIGNVQLPNIQLNLIVQNSKIIINKIDSDTNTTTPSGEGSLKGTTFAIYNNFNTKIKELTLEEENIKIEGLNYGKYYIKEITPGIGYTTNPNKYYFTISETNTNHEITIKNKIIEKEIIIKKVYGTNNNFKPEENINFNIYDSKDNFITTIITNKEGIASIILPYGKYTIKQLTTTEGYQKVEPIQVIVDNQEQKTILLKNYKINVPNTSTKGIYSIIINIWEKIKLFLAY